MFFDEYLVKKFDANKQNRERHYIGIMLQMLGLMLQFFENELFFRCD
jgi:hypothetical protein